MFHQTVKVSARAPWVYVFQLKAGLVYQVQAEITSRWNTNPAIPDCDANGNGRLPSWDFLMSGIDKNGLTAYEGQLLGALQYDPSPRPMDRFIINSAITIPAQPADIGLYLSINDDYRMFYDNYGELTVYIYW